MSKLPPLAPTPRSLEILGTLIGFATVSRDSNLGLIEWVRDRLAAAGIAARLSYDATRTKANLFATIGPPVDGGIVLSGHTDVVPVDGQDWDTDPFKATVVGDRLFGRGACDMKGFLAAVLANLDSLVQAPLTRPIHLAFTYDEEVGCQGVRTLLADLESQGIRPAACVVGEPTEMQIVRTHKGSRNYRCCVRGVEAHASRTQDGVNAIQYAAQIVAHVHQVSEDLASAPRPDSAFETPYSTIQTSLIKGGLARNIVPRDCEFTFGYRYLPDDDPDAIFARVEQFGLGKVLPAMRARARDTDVSFARLSDNPALRSTPANGLLTRFLDSLPGVDGVGPGVSYMTEGGLYQRAGIESVICGPGSIVQAHRPNEYVTLDQIARCEAFVQELGRHTDRYFSGTADR